MSAEIRTTPTLTVGRRQLLYNSRTPIRAPLFDVAPDDQRTFRLWVAAGADSTRTAAGAGAEFPGRAQGPPLMDASQLARPRRPLPGRARARRRRHGHRLPRARPQARPQGRHQGAAPRARRGHRRRRGSSPRSRPPPTCSIRTSCRCTIRAQVDGTVFYVMPFVEGESLRDRLNREKQLPIADAVRIATEVAGALDYAHRQRVIHRDIKPENILLHDGHALVADFGIALAATSADSPDDRDRDEPRHAALHESRAGDGGAEPRRAHRRLRAGLRAVRDADRRAAVHRPHRAGDRGQGDDRRAGTGLHLSEDGASARRGSGDRRAGQAPGRPLCDRRPTWRTRSATRRRVAECIPAGFTYGTRREGRFPTGILRGRRSGRRAARRGADRVAASRALRGASAASAWCSGSIRSNSSSHPAWSTTRRRPPLRRMAPASSSSIRWAARRNCSGSSGASPIRRSSRGPRGRSLRSFPRMAPGSATSPPMAGCERSRLAAEALLPWPPTATRSTTPRPGSTTAPSSITTSSMTCGESRPMAEPAPSSSGTPTGAPPS